VYQTDLYRLSGGSPLFRHRNSSERQIATWLNDGSPMTT
jgi:hypothetical protein